MELQRERWLKLTSEEPLEPNLPICDPHHHLWDSPDDLPENRITASHRHIRHYLLKELLGDIGGGHNIVKTVFIECGSMYRKEGPPEFRSIGETEFVQGVAAQSASGQYGNIEVASGIVGFADLALGSAVPLYLRRISQPVGADFVGFAILLPGTRAVKSILERRAPGCCWPRSSGKDLRV